MAIIHQQPRTPRRHQLKFRLLPGTYAVTRFQKNADVPEWVAEADFVSITRTEEELSIVCPTEKVPASLRPSLRWMCLKLEGPFPFSQTGILLSFIEPLSDNGVPVFAISTYDTDYVLIQEDLLEKAIAALQQSGHQLAKS